MLALISEIIDAKLEPQIDIVLHGVKDEATAFAVEAALIDSIQTC